MDRQKDYQKVPERNVVLHKDNLWTVFQLSHQFDMLFHLLQRQPYEQNSIQGNIWKTISIHLKY